MGNKKSRPTSEEPCCFFSIEDHDDEQRVNLKDATPPNLQTLFELQSPPKTLKSEDGTCIFYNEASTWSTELNKGCHYKVKIPKAEGKFHMQQQSSNWLL